MLTEADVLKVAAEVPEPPREEPTSSGKTEVDPRELPISEKTTDLIFNGNNGAYATRSEADAAVVTALIAAACTDAQIFHIFENHPIGEKYHSKKQHKKSYLQGTIDKFRKTTEIKATITEEKIEKPIWECDELLKADFPVPPMVIGQGILPEGAGMIIEGESEAGKSLLRLELAIHLATGQPCWGLPIATPRRVFVFQFENTLAEERFRLKRMIEGLDVSEDSIRGRIAISDPRVRVNLALKKDYMKAYQVVKQSRADVIIWDPLSSIHTVNENDNIQVRAVLDTLTSIARQTKTTTILIHHFGKPGIDGAAIPLRYRGRGASSIRDWADTKLAVVIKPNEERELRELHFTKIRNGPPRPPLLLERNKHFVHRIVSEETLCAVSVVAEVIHLNGGFVESQAALIEAIVSETGAKQRTAQRRIHEAVQQGIVIEEKQGRKKGYSIRAQ